MLHFRRVRPPGLSAPRSLRYLQTPVHTKRTKCNNMEIDRPGQTANGETSTSGKQVAEKLPVLFKLLIQAA